VKITQFLHQQIRPNPDIAKLSTRYNKTIIPGIHLINNRIADIHRRLLRVGCTQKSFVGPNNKALHLHYKQNFDPVHYLINCPAFPAYILPIKQLLTPVQHNLTDTEKAAIIIHKVTANP